MINDFQVRNFRHLQTVDIQRLRRVNLFVGKNSSGKSALLEAFLLFFSQMSFRYLSEIHAVRQEMISLRGVGDNISPLRHLFAGHQLPDINEPGIKLSSREDRRSFEIKVIAFVEEERIVENIGPIRIPVPAPDEIVNSEPDAYKPFISMVKGSNVTRIIGVSEHFKRIPASSFLRRRNPEGVGCFYIPTGGLSDNETAALWDSISLTSLEPEVLTGLRLVEPRVEDIAFVASGIKRVPIIRMLDATEPVPLKSLGDGINRIFQIILALMSAKGGALLIDEFENGLHWSVQEAIWNVVFQLAQSLDVQVFATTHSRDCIKGFESAWSNAPEDGAFARIDRQSSGVKITEYDLELLEDSLDTDVEVR